ncbi:MAG: hypothetical protein R6U67_01735 [Sodalinema sp.]|uniref:hypothetical protein n=1 Tax=Sodalinema sp. TaxID=3080550 RepID=UPI00396F41D4
MRTKLLSLTAILGLSLFLGACAEDTAPTDTAPEGDPMEQEAPMEGQPGGMPGEEPEGMPGGEPEGMPGGEPEGMPEGMPEGQEPMESPMEPETPDDE